MSNERLLLSLTFKSLQKGDVVWALRIPHFHCGIYEGDNSVIHFAAQDGSKTKENAVVHRTSFEQFANGLPVVIIEFPEDKCFPPDKVVENARSRLGEKGYSPFFKNCDHFATWCKTGEHRSLQVDFAKKAATVIAEVIAGESGKKYADIVCEEVFGTTESYYSPEKQDSDVTQA